MADRDEPNGLDAAYGKAPTDGREATGDPGAPAAAATDSMAELEQRAGDARANQARRAAEAGEADGGPDAPAR